MADSAGLSDSSAGARICGRCGKGFTCGLEAGAAPCWCAALPNVLPVPAAGAAGCLCPDCLRSALTGDGCRTVKPKV